MRLSILSLAGFIAVVAGQTYTDCNPLKTTCKADKALGGSITAVLTSASTEFVAAGSGAVTYGLDGATLRVAKSGDSPMLVSQSFIMFGRVDVVVKTAPGAGIVSSIVLQSDTLDEIDWEWLGGTPNEVQTNFFGKGTLDHTNSLVYSNPAHSSGFHTYTVDWTAERIRWEIDNVVVRELTPAIAGDLYPQTPMQVKIGPWAGGDPLNNVEGTVIWAGGPTDFSNGPFDMVIKSISSTDYSTGTSYEYTDRTGRWQSIKAVGGSVNGNIKADTTGTAVASTASVPVSTAPARTEMAGPASRTDPSSSSSGSVSQKYPGLPAGWTVTSDGKVRPPSTAPAGSVSSSVSTSSASASPTSHSPSTTKSTAAPRPSSTAIPSTSTRLTSTRSKPTSESESTSTSLAGSPSADTTVPIPSSGSSTNSPSATQSVPRSLASSDSSSSVSSLSTELASTSTLTTSTSALTSSASTPDSTPVSTPTPTSTPTSLVSSPVGQSGTAAPSGTSSPTTQFDGSAVSNLRASLPLISAALLMLIVI